MFNFGVFLCYLAVPSPLVAAVLGAPLWLVALLPVAGLLLGLMCMGIGEAIEWGPVPKSPGRQRADLLFAELDEITRELNDEVGRRVLLREPPYEGEKYAALRARFEDKCAEVHQQINQTAAT